MKYGYGFTFNNKHSSELNIISKSDDRSLLPARRRNEFIIPGRDGTLDFGSNRFENRIITLNITLINHNLEDLRNSARAAALWLSGKGLLIFDDEKDKAYNAKIYSALSIAQLIKCGESQISFECSPFAESPLYNQVNADIQDSGFEIPINVEGTQETPCFMYIKNTGSDEVRNILITLKTSEG